MEGEVGAARSRGDGGGDAIALPLNEIVLVRHGQTDWSRAGRHTGRTDVPLDDTGRVEARRVGEVLGSWRFARVLTSPLSRASDTARLAGFPEAERDDDLREWDYGDYEGLRTAEIQRERPRWSLFADGVPGGENAGQVAGRVDRLIAGLRAGPGPCAVFAHGHLLRVLAVRWLGLPPEVGAHLVLDPGSVSVLGYEHGVPAIERWNTR